MAICRPAFCDAEQVDLSGASDRSYNMPQFFLGGFLPDHGRAETIQTSKQPDRPMPTNRAHRSRTSAARTKKLRSRQPRQLGTVPRPHDPHTHRPRTLAFCIERHHTGGNSRGSLEPLLGKLRQGRKTGRGGSAVPLHGRQELIASDRRILESTAYSPSDSCRLPSGGAVCEATMAGHTPEGERQGTYTEKKKLPIASWTWSNNPPT